MFLASHTVVRRGLAPCPVSIYFSSRHGGFLAGRKASLLNSQESTRTGEMNCTDVVGSHCERQMLSRRTSQRSSLASTQARDRPGPRVFSWQMRGTSSVLSLRPRRVQPWHSYRLQLRRILCPCRPTSKLSRQPITQVLATTAHTFRAKAVPRLLRDADGSKGHDADGRRAGSGFPSH